MKCTCDPDTLCDACKKQICARVKEIASSKSSKVDGVKKKKSDDKRLVRIAAACGINAQAHLSTKALARACLKKCHPDKKVDFNEARDRANVDYLLGLIRNSK
jgi:hypothetical protein